ncbi:hypothetical protein M0R45_018725 [Rubus argutus]|uniref:F-box associated beta-propeller type 3 domain-containing protein n=1 Tax=Rubus argutus TaxID=59490 RepID=A0AAW1X4X6_RUBAR
MEEDAETVVPDEIMCFHILPTLPAKFLMRLRCVCKPWSSLIHNPYFISTYRNIRRHRQHSHLLFLSHEKDATQQRIFSVEINKLEEEGSSQPLVATHLRTLLACAPHRLYYAQSVNGLVCFSLSNTSNSYLEVLENPSIHILNPSTREFITLPHASRMYHTEYVTHHFGFSPLTNQYKVLRVERYDPRWSSLSFIFKVFTLGTNCSWKCLEVDLSDLPFDLSNFQFSNKSVCVHGAIHWLHEPLNIIVVFDIEDERFRVIELPPGVGVHPRRRLAEVDGCLALMDGQWQKYTMGLWVLKDYQNKVWLKDNIAFPFQYSLVQGSGTGPVRLHQYDMKSKRFRIGEIILPKWKHNHNQVLHILTSYGEDVVPLSSS